MDKLWGYPSLARALNGINTDRTSPDHHLVCQISSIATLSANWIDQFFTALIGKPAVKNLWKRASVVFPTATDVAKSLDGYASGGSIHAKAQSQAHLKQINSMRTGLCQWTAGPQQGARAGRDLAAPHIKTYVQFQKKPTALEPTPDIEWALVTSANLSTQAWGILREKEKEVVVQSFEIGVLIWPDLFSRDFDSEAGPSDNRNEIGNGNHVRMVPVFGKDTPMVSAVEIDRTASEAPTIVGFRMAYDLPLTPYAHGALPWSPQGTYDTPDLHGRRWPQDFV
jgi:tyrosyl-DNA phosphodiesterase-1